MRLLKKLVSKTNHLRLWCGKAFLLIILIFSDASRTIDHGQISYIAGLLFDPLESGSVYHTFYWTCNKSKCPVMSIGSAEILSTGESIVLKKGLSKLLNIPVYLHAVVDSKDLFSTLSTCRNAIEKSIRGDVIVIRYEFETKTLNKLIWIPGRTIEPGTNP